LKPVPGDSTRPITDRVKESLFNIIGGDIVDATILDLFAGTGSVGIEALSRGAKSCTFLDINRTAIGVLKANIDATDFTAQSQVKQVDSLKYLKQVPDRVFDYLYIAPPQYKEMWIEALRILDQNDGWSGKDGWLIAQIHPIEYQELTLDHFTEFDRRVYGSTLLTFYEHSNG
jgi:16S rRNA (guanine966-N2)-methyltransferase